MVTVDGSELRLKMSYDNLWILLREKGMRKQDLRARTGISSGTMAKLGKVGNVTTDVLLRICQVLNCQIGDIVEVVPASETKEEDA